MPDSRQLTTDKRGSTSPRCLLYYITNRTAFPGDESARRQHLLEKIAEAARAGVDYIQLREKDLPTRELESLAREAVSILNQLRAENREPRTALLINSRTDIAFASGADGVHLRSDDVTPEDVRAAWRNSQVGTAAFGCPVPQNGVDAPARESRQLIGVSCHSPAEVAKAADSGASFAVFAPVFEKKDAPATQPAGLAALREACRVSIPILALGGVTPFNARSCLESGAAGIAAIRLFQDNDVATVVSQLCSSL